MSKVNNHYIEVAQGAFFMEQNMRFGLILYVLRICYAQLGTDVVWREKKFKQKVFYKYFCLG